MCGLIFLTSFELVDGIYENGLKKKWNCETFDKARGMLRPCWRSMVESFCANGNGQKSSTKITRFANSAM